MAWEPGLDRLFGDILDRIEKLEQFEKLEPDDANLVARVQALEDATHAPRAAPPRPYFGVGKWYAGNRDSDGWYLHDGVQYLPFRIKSEGHARDLANWLEVNAIPCTLHTPPTTNSA